MGRAPGLAPQNTQTDFRLMHCAPVNERAHRVTLSDRSGEFLRTAAAGAGGVGGEKTVQQVVQVHGDHSRAIG
ncbi:hypothetical protein KAM429_30620 [Aquipseudomonas alcaligenes]|uniref:Uncharacterized protein n=1 Tax=Aquipseudomonas alcaligenes TaxID=43263 RepID=A0AA37FML4_AQUAC|nr:hypothetical protein KAM426_09040 [Pseudomonas alcaligenes]GIZ72301.1 hypothetical protein KAM429_30620 [Pseudomonas alcaligenes]GIZ76652.1 hypothetical protein KAM430_30610 [Pseudomonas alcaligenes]GIZ85347.1 hypothetical protein KAM434_30420 [Pseudomonas alcaligenes]GIZ89668.1 hypothetical protein KAM435_29950 [Pseudomonas alcaligenes]